MKRFFLVLLLLALLMFTGCSSDSSDDTPDGDDGTTDGDSDGDADGDGDDNTDGDADGDTDSDGDFEDGSCENPVEIPDTPWTPQSVHTDAPYRQEQSRLFEGDSLPGLVRSVYPLDETHVVLGAMTGLYKLDAASVQNDPQLLSNWPAMDYYHVAVLSDGTIAAVCGITLYLGTADAAPREVEVPAGITALAPGPDGSLYLLVNNDEIGRVEKDATDYELLAGDLSYVVNDICQVGNRLFLATDEDVKQMALDTGTISDRYAVGQATRFVTGIACPSENELWFGIQDGLVHDDNGTITTLGGSDGLPYGGLTVMRLGGDGRLLLPTSMGLITYDPAETFWDYYHSRYWVPDWNIRGAASLPDGSLFVATETGLGWIYPTPMTLEEKAAVLDDGMATRHDRDGMFSGCRLTTPGDLTSAVTRDDDNDGQWTNQYLASQVFRYLATGDAAAKALAKKAADAMLLLLNVTGKDGFFARSVVAPELCPQMNETGGEWHVSGDGKYCWKGDTSSDEYVGHMFGLSIYYDYLADEAEKEVIRDTFVRLHDGIIAHGYILEDIDGEITTHGHFEPQFMQGFGQYGDGGLNSAMILGGLRFTYLISGEQRFMDAFDYLAFEEGYAENVRQIQIINHVFHINHDAEEMSFLAMTTLMRLETDPCRMALWREGLDYLWETQRPERNPEFNFLYAWLTRSEGNDLENSVRTLKEMYLHGVTWAVDNRHRIDIEIDPALDRHDKVQSFQVVPYDQNEAFRWAENPYCLEWNGHGTYERMLTPWLLPYWLGRYLGLITEGNP